jgi:hypothetical protein
MNFAEIKSFIKSQVRENTTELDPLIEQQVNRVHRKLCRLGNWPQLRVDGNTFQTVANQQHYDAPYDIERLTKDSVRYGVTSSDPGYILPINTMNTGSNVMLYQGSMANTSGPQSVELVGGNGNLIYQSTTPLYNGQSSFIVPYTNIINYGFVGKFIVFTSSDGKYNTGDYGFKITSAALGIDQNSVVYSLGGQYRGPDIYSDDSSVVARAEIKPRNNPRLFFTPLFTDGNQPITFSYQRKPLRLWNDYDTPEVDSLSESICWEVIALLGSYHKDEQLMTMAKNESRSLFAKAKSNLL